MPAEFWSDATRMLTAGAIVAAVALPVGLVAWSIARRRAETLLPIPKPWRVPWGGFEVVLAFLLLTTIPVVLVQGEMPPLTAGVVALPIQLVLLVVGWRVICPAWRPARSQGFAARVALAVFAWALLTPPVLAFYTAVLQLFTALNWQPNEHPLTQLGNLSAQMRWLFFLQACITAPLIEEILFRGLLLPWAIGGRERHTGRPAIPLLVSSVVRPWLVMLFAVVYAATTRKADPIIFAGALAGGLGLLWVTIRHGKRQLRGVYATAAFFAVVHSGVWPSPLPLFLLGLGLGWLAVRTRGVLVPFLVHGLFNAVSAVFVLRGSAG